MKNPARCAASCTESEKAISFLSSLKGLPQLCSMVTAPIVVLRAPSRSWRNLLPHAGQVGSCQVEVTPPAFVEVRDAVTRNTSTRSP